MADKTCQCGYPLATGITACPHCGQLAKGFKLCTCGHTVAKNVWTCPKCGHRYTSVLMIVGSISLVLLLLWAAVVYILNH
jgi:uncharacterized protein (UPF0212 family)